MLKRISTKNLILGMYLHEFCGSWMEYPFWRAKVRPEGPQRSGARIQATAIDEVWIDTSKGLDVAAGVSSVSREEADLQIDSEFAQLEDMPAIVIEEPPRPALPRRGREPTSMQDEIQLAASICSESKRAVVSMFDEAHMGQAVDAANAQSLVEEISDSVRRNPGALISLARLKTADDYTYMHSVAVCAMMVALAEQIGLSEERTAQRRHGRPAARPGQGRHPAARSEQAWQAHRQRVRGGRKPPGRGLRTLLKEAAMSNTWCLTPACTTTKKWMAQATPTGCRATRSR